MRKTSMFLSGGRGAAVLVGLLLLATFVASACGGPAEVAVGSTAAPTERPAATELPTEPPAPTTAPTEPPTPTDAPTEPPPTETPLPTDTPMPTDTPTPEPVDDTACIGCHTDEETLKAVAVEEEKPEVESEGEG